MSSFGPLKAVEMPSWTFVFYPIAGATRDIHGESGVSAVSQEE